MLRILFSNQVPLQIIIYYPENRILTGKNTNKDNCSSSGAVYKQFISFKPTLLELGENNLNRLEL